MRETVTFLGLGKNRLNHDLGNPGNHEDLSNTEFNSVPVQAFNKNFSLLTFNTYKV